MGIDHNSQEAVDLLESTFSSWDASGDGTISKSELRNVLVRLGITGENVDVLFKSMDTNHDGKVSYTEFIAFLYKGTPAAMTLDPRMAAKTVDEAMDRIYEFMSDKKGEEKDNDKTFTDKDIFEMLDLNGNGKVSISEFIQGLRSMEVNGSRPFTAHEFPDSLLHKVFKLLLKAKKKDLESKALSLKSFKTFLAHEQEE
mmetsp:Transcript_102124/g.255926  ORF Transcript_102124/g.255926 Transcript_102124/m.255926 type:complete len:199 (+) Transcript_102124:98-694(+)